MPDDILIIVLTCKLDHVHFIINQYADVLVIQHDNVYTLPKRDNAAVFFLMHVCSVACQLLGQLNN